MWIAFALYNTDGTPRAGAAPTFTAYKDRAGANRTAPTIDDLGLGLYQFEPTAADRATGVAYLVNGGTSGYVAGVLGSSDLFAFAVYDSAGAPYVSATPTFASYQTQAGAEVTPPTVVNLGLGLYAFVPAAPELSAGAAYEIATGQYPERLAGTVDAFSASAPGGDPASDLAAELVARNPVGGATLVLGSNLFIGREREEEHAGVFPRVTLLNYGGSAPSPYLGTGESHFNGSVQVRIRGAPDQFSLAEALARGVIEALHLASIVGYVEIESQDSVPAYLGSDTSGRDVWTIDFRCGWTA